jgi:DNA polymerase-3 subunit delta
MKAGIINLQMIRSLVGDNSFALQQSLKQYVGAFIAEHGDIAVERLEGGEADFERLQASLQSVPFLADKKMVVIRSGSANKQFTEQAERLLSGLPETTELVLVEPSVDKRSSYYKLLKKATDLEEFAEQDEQGLARWLVSAAKEQGATISSGDARLLVEYVGTNQQMLASELDKLISYDSNVTHTSIELLVEPAPQSKIFDLLDAAFAGNPKRAMELYHEQREQKVDPSQIIALLAWQLRILALLLTANGRTDSDMARDAKLSPYTIQKSQGIARKLTFARLKQLVSDLVKLDVRSKRQNIDLDEALQNYLLALAQSWTI